MHSTRAARCSVAGRVLFLAVSGLLFVALTATPSPALAQTPSPHRFIPAKGLVAYFEYDGLQLHAAAWKATAAHGLLVDTPAGSMMTELARQLLDELLKLEPSVKLTGAELLACHDHLMQHGIVIAVHDSGNGTFTTTIVVNRASEGAIRKQLDRLAELVFADQEKGKPAATVKFRGRDVYQRVDKPKAAPPERSVPLGQQVPGRMVPLGTPAPLGESVPPGQPVAGQSVPIGAPGTAGEPVPLGQPRAGQSVPIPGTAGEPIPLGQPVAGQSVPIGAPGTAGEPVPLGQPRADQSVPIPGTAGEPIPLGQQVPFGQPAGEIRPDATFAPPISTWYEGGDLVLIAGPSDDSFALVDPEKQKVLIAAHLKHRTAVFDTIDGNQPNVETNAAYLATAAQGKDIKGFDPNGLFFVEASSRTRLLASGLEQSLPPQLQALSARAPVPDLAFVVRPRQITPIDPTKPAQPDAAKAPYNPLAELGLDGVKRIAGRWGFQGKALFTDVRIEAPAPRKGLVAILDQPTFSKDRLPPFPRDAATFAVESFDLGQAYQMLVTGLKAVEPEVGEQINQFEKSFQQTAGVRLHDDVLKRLGPTWTVFRFPTEAGPNVREKTELDVTDYALLASVDDSAAVLKMLDGFAARVNQYFRDAYKVPGRNEDDLPILSLERLPAPDRGYQLTSPTRLVLWLNDARPTILVGKSFVSCAASLERARLALAGETNAAGAWKPSGALHEALECLPDRLNFLAVVDHRDSAVPEAIAGLPATVQSLAAILTLDDAPADAPAAASILSLFGIPRPGGFRVRIPPSKLPTAEQLRSHLFPSVIATTVDEHGFRVLAREAFPFVCLGNPGSLKPTIKLGGN